MVTGSGRRDRFPADPNRDDSLEREVRCQDGGSEAFVCRMTRGHDTVIREIVASLRREIEREMRGRTKIVLQLRCARRGPPMPHSWMYADAARATEFPREWLLRSQSSCCGPVTARFTSTAVCSPVGEAGRRSRPQCNSMNFALEGTPSPFRMKSMYQPRGAVACGCHPFGAVAESVVGPAE